MKYIFISLVIVLLGGCGLRTLSIDDNEVEYYEITWKATESLRSESLIFNVKNDVPKKMITNILNKSKVTFPLKDDVLVEGWYELKVIHTNSATKTFEISGGDSLFHVERNIEYKNDELLLFIYQLLFYEFMKSGVVLE